MIRRLIENDIRANKLSSAASFFYGGSGKKQEIGLDFYQKL